MQLRAVMAMGRDLKLGNDDPPLDLKRSFMPEALAGLSSARMLDDTDRRWLNQIRAASYVHLFDVFETSLGEAVRTHGAREIDAREVLVPLLRLDAFDHNELFRSFERQFAKAFPVRPKLIARPADLDAALDSSSPLALLVLALHLKLVTQQHYLACVRGDETLEPRFVRLLKDHWNVECGAAKTCSSSLAIQQALGDALPGRIPAALRDYKRLVFTCDDVLARQTELDVTTLEAVRKSPFASSERTALLASQIAAHRKTFLTVGIVNAAFVYAMRSLGPSAPAMLAGVVSALGSRS